MSRPRYGTPEKWWPTVYVEQTVVNPAVPHPHDAAVERFGLDVVRTLLDMLPASSPSGEYPALVKAVGKGVADHDLSEGQLTLPRIAIVTPPGRQQRPALHNYRYSPKTFDIYQAWTEPGRVVDALDPVVARLNRLTKTRRGQDPDLTYVTEAVKSHRDQTVSSHRVGRLAAGIAAQIVTVECAAIGYPAENTPQVGFEWLHIATAADGIITERSEAV